MNLALQNYYIGYNDLPILVKLVVLLNLAVKFFKLILYKAKLAIRLSFYFVSFCF